MCTCVCVCRRKLERNENEGKKIVSIQCLSTSIVKLHGRLTSIIDILSNSGILIYKYFLTKIFVEAMKKKKKTQNRMIKFRFRLTVRLIFLISVSIPSLS